MAAEPKYTMKQIAACASLIAVVVGGSGFTIGTASNEQKLTENDALERIEKRLAAIDTSITGLRMRLVIDSVNAINQREKYDTMYAAIKQVSAKVDRLASGNFYSCDAFVTRSYARKEKTP